MDHGELGQKLREIRESQGRSLRDVARGSPDLTASAISRIERGERYPSLLTLEVLAHELDLEIKINPQGTTVKER